MIQNLKSNIFQKNKDKEHAAMEIIKDCATSKNYSTRSSKKMIQKFLSLKEEENLKIILKPRKKQKSKTIPVNVLQKMQRDYNLSDRGLYGVAHSVRKGMNNSIKFENKFNQKLKESSHALDHSG